MSFEDELARLNEHFFFREFTNSRTTFRPSAADEVELADHVLWLDDLLVVFQLKERTVDRTTSQAEEQKWYEKKVIDKGTRQIRETLNYLDANKAIQLTNHRGHTFELANAAIKQCHKLICYRPRDNLPAEAASKKFHRSRTAGIIHLFQAQDYRGIIETLLTPAEFAEYLEFREELICKWEEHLDDIPESALVGQYLSGNAEVPPNLEFCEYLEALDHRADEWDISGIIKTFPNRMTGGGNATDYYAIVQELAKLKRTELREFKKRFQLSMEKCRSDSFTVPYRFFVPRTGCGFLFVPLEPAMVPGRAKGLQNLTHGCKYDFKADKCIGVSFAPDGDEWYAVEWCLLEHAWAHDAELEQRLVESYPFRKTRTAELGRYTYHDE